MRNAFSDALVAAAVADPNVLLLTGDHGYALFDAFRKARPGQYINCGVAEQNMVGVAAGLAKGGFRPIVYGLAAFVPIRVLEQIKIDVCSEQLGVVLIGDGAGFVYGHLGSSHQSTEDIAATRSIPGLAVLSPADRFEMTATMQLALSLGTPVYMRVGKSDRGDVHAAPVALRAGQMLCVRPGKGSVAILATGSMVRTAIDVAPAAADAEVWSVPSIKPFDGEQLAAIAHHADALVTMEEHSTMGGLGACVAEQLAALRPRPLLRVGVEDRFSQFCGSWDYLLHEHALDTTSVRQRVERFVARNREIAATV
ncbi:transketolase [Ramlibacter ginsenosidimutans]|uniref:Transketolase n=1 Tax=Ramlibacter ginsenosidimutans TaxID=502333 RepID=A0A934TNJ6_9BURK|nr:transketolase C-terminal domain-containing protein [Ramlibacter ginsenosidimutans]MBK6004598.1 transketolase [Ramlibacter ginsenosidimutans]